MEFPWVLPAIVALIAAGVSLTAFFRSPLAEAWAERIRQSSRRRRHWKGLGGEWLDVPVETGADEQRVAELEERLTALGGQVSELAERLDFAERLLAERREHKLGAGR
ncbi:MAG: hypothetical protein ACREMV_02880 [Gemmatimonadales bacterium]